MTRLLLSIICMIFFSARQLPVCHAEEKQIDSLALASKLVKTGEYEKAKKALEQLSQKQIEQDIARYQTVKGLIDLYQKRFQLAETAFLKALSANKNDRYLHIYLAQSYFGQNRFLDTLKTLSEVKELSDSIASMYSIKAKSLWQLKRYDEAIVEANRGLKKFPEDFRLHRLKLSWLAERQLFAQIHDYGKTLVDDSKLETNDLLSIAGILRSHDQLNLAISFLEILRLKRPSDSVSSQLALSYAKKEDFTTAAILFEQMAMLDATYYYEAAELYARAGNHQYALNLNSRVINQKKKFKQKLTILLSQQDFELASHCEEDLVRLGLTNQEEISYALAYAFFRNRNFDKAEHYLNRITGSSLFKKSVALRKEILTCKRTDGNCAA
jgi:tetratricopeptide (TPR) repeat protein